MAGAVAIEPVNNHGNNPSDGTFWYYAACAICGWASEWDLSFYTVRHDQVVHMRKGGHFARILRAANVDGMRPARRDVPQVKAPKPGDVLYFWRCGRCASRSRLYAKQGAAWQGANGHNRQTGHSVEVVSQDRRTDKWVETLCGAPLRGEAQEVLF